MSGRPGTIAWARLPVPVVVCALALFVIAQALATMRADLASQGARRLIAHWVSHAAAMPSPAALAQARADLATSLVFTPDNAALHEQLGDLEWVASRLAQQAGEDNHAPDAADASGERLARLAAAARHYRSALALQPLDPQTWAGLALVLQAAGDTEAAQSAWATALLRGPHEGHVQPMLLELVLSDWPAATQRMQGWAISLFAQATERDRLAINRAAARHALRFELDDEPPVDRPGGPPP